MLKTQSHKEVSRSRIFAHCQEDDGRIVNQALKILQRKKIILASKNFYYTLVEKSKPSSAKHASVSTGSFLGIFLDRDATGKGYIQKLERYSPQFFLQPYEYPDLKPLTIIECIIENKAVIIQKTIDYLTHDCSFYKLALHELCIPHEENEIVLNTLHTLKHPSLDDGYEDLRHLPFITIDGEDAQDFDDAVCTQIMPDGTLMVYVAIADVSWYVQENTPLDHHAKERGNSVYFPGFAVPMLPKILSNHYCSLLPHEDRPTFAVSYTLNEEGEKLNHRFMRAFIHSQKRYTYTDVEQTLTNNLPFSEFEKITLLPLQQAYKALNKARLKRHTLDIQGCETVISFNKEKNIQTISNLPHYSSHKFIEELMIMANVCAAQTLFEHKIPFLYRSHDEPCEEKIIRLQSVLEAYGIPLAKKQKKWIAKDFNAILHKTQSKPYEKTITQGVLRAQSQAMYTPMNGGHFGLSLEKYTHFTSPIRRYCDILVHRALLHVLSGSKQSSFPKIQTLEKLGEHLSMTERRATSGERNTQERLKILNLSRSKEDVFPAYIREIITAGIFLEIPSLHVEGFLPIQSLDDDYYIFHKKTLSLLGKRTKKQYVLGQTLSVKIEKISSFTRTVLFSIHPPLPFQKKKMRRSPTKET